MDKSRPRKLKFKPKTNTVARHVYAKMCTHMHLTNQTKFETSPVLQTSIIKGLTKNAICLLCQDTTSYKQMQLTEPQVQNVVQNFLQTIL